MIDILVPVLDRPHNAQPLVDNIHAVQQVPTTIIFLCSRDDVAQIEACKATGAVTWLCEQGSYAAKINEGCLISLRSDAHPFVFTGADDLRFHPGWDVKAIAAHENTGKMVVGTNDLGNPSVTSGQHATHSLVLRDYIQQGTVDEPGKLLHEGYSHNYVDSELVATAKWRDQWVFAPDSIVEHLHPFWRKGEDDRTYELGRRTYHADARTFRKRQHLWQ